MGLFKAVGLVIILMYLSHAFSESVDALNRAATASFNALEAAATLSVDTFDSTR